MITIKDYFEKRDQGISVSVIANGLNKSRKWIQRALSNAGYSYSKTLKSWEYEGSGAEPLEKNLEDFIQDANVKANENSSDSKVKASDSKVKASNSKVIASASNAIASNDEIDIIFRKQTQEKTDKSYRGYYLDQDIIMILDQVGAGDKSRLVNEALKKVFREKGLL